MPIRFYADFAPVGSFIEFTTFDASSHPNPPLYVSSTDPIDGTYSAISEWHASNFFVQQDTAPLLPAGTTNVRIGLKFQIVGSFSFGTLQTTTGFHQISGVYNMELRKVGSKIVIGTSSIALESATDINDGEIHTFELRLVKETAPSANDGIESLYIDGILQDENTGVDNESYFDSLTGGSPLNCYRLRITDGTGHSGSLRWDLLVVRNDDTVIFPAPPVPPYTLAAMSNQSVDIDKEGDNLFISILNGGLPLLLKMPTDLESDPSIVFEPGAGSNIGVRCGRQDGDIVYVGGDFGSTFMELSSDGGSSFSAIDTGTGNKVSSFVVGDTDSKVLVAEEDEVLYSTHSNIQETSDSGTTWTERNASVPEVITDISRKDKNIQEVVFGSDIAGTDEVLYSVNSGADVEGYSTGFPVSDVTKVIVL